jgi:dCMP deaminase
MSKVDWHKRYLDLTETYASWSKDRSTGVGAVIVTDDNTDIVKGYNGFPRGANDDVDERHERPAKYDWTEHAERNAIFKAAREGISTKGCSMYINRFPCVECTRGIIQSGITKIIIPEKPDLTHHKWGESWRTAIEMLEECGVEIIYFNNG